MNAPGLGRKTSSHRRFPVVTFVHPDPPSTLAQVIEGPGAAFQEFLRSITSSGRDTWILGTYARLRRRGLPVSLTDAFQPGELCIAHRDDVARHRRPWDCFVVSVRADRDRTFHCHMEIVQSPANLEARGCHYLPHWPMPGLLPRDPARGNRLERIGYFGLERNLAARFRSPELLGALADLGVALSIRSDPEGWHDYSDVDLILAVRDGTPEFLGSKPATKLFNAWIAGCPAIVGREPAYDHHGAAGTDYLRIDTAKDLLRLLQRLRDAPETYRALRERCALRAAEVNEAATLERWIGWLTEVAGPAHAHWARAGRLGRAGTELLRTARARLRLRLRGDLRQRGFDIEGNPVPVRRSPLRRAALWVDRQWTRLEGRELKDRAEPGRSA